MKRNYTLSIAAILLLVNVSCYKALSPGYSKNIEGGPWYIKPTSNNAATPLQQLDFDHGFVNFLPGRQLEYTDKWMKLYKGTWEFDQYTYYDENDQEQRAYYLKMVAVNDQGQDNFSQYYGVEFDGPDQFQATVYTSAGTYTFEFRR